MRLRPLRPWICALCAAGTAVACLPPNAIGEDGKGVLEAVEEKALEARDRIPDAVKEKARFIDEGGEEARDPFVLRGQRGYSPPSDGGEAPTNTSYDLLDLSRLTVRGIMRMADGSRVAVLDMDPRGPFVVEAGQPILLSGLDGEDILFRVREIGDQMLTLSLADGREMMLPVAGAPGKKKARSQVQGGQAQQKGKGK